MTTVKEARVAVAFKAIAQTAGTQNITESLALAMATSTVEALFPADPIIDNLSMPRGWKP